MELDALQAADNWLVRKAYSPSFTRSRGKEGLRVAANKPEEKHGRTWHVMVDFTLTNHAHGRQGSGQLGLLETPLAFSAPEGL